MAGLGDAELVGRLCTCMCMFDSFPSDKLGWVLKIGRFVGARTGWEQCLHHYGILKYSCAGTAAVTDDTLLWIKNSLSPVSSFFII